MARVDDERQLDRELAGRIRKLAQNPERRTVAHDVNRGEQTALNRYAVIQRLPWSRTRITARVGGAPNDVPSFVLNEGKQNRPLLPHVSPADRRIVQKALR